LFFVYSYITWEESEFTKPKKKFLMPGESGHWIIIIATGRNAKRREWKDIMPRRLTTEEFISKAKLLHGEKYDYIDVKYTGSFDKVTIICSKHGLFLQNPSKHLLGSGCYECGFDKIARANSKYSTLDFIEMAVLLHKKKYNYSNTIYKSYDSNVLISCPIHGDFLQRASHHLNGRGCPKCAGFHKTTSDIIFQLENLNGSKYDYSNVIYKNNKTKIEIICKMHGEFWQKPSDHLNGQQCPRCIGYISKKEIEFLQYLNIPDKKENRQLYICGHKTDGFKNNMIFEFFGDYWHGNPTKFNSNDINVRCNQTYGTLYNKTMHKLKIFKSNGYKVYYMWENDWNLWKKNKTNPFPLKKY
jgi:hypothetical protein